MTLRISGILVCCASAFLPAAHGAVADLCPGRFPVTTPNAVLSIPYCADFDLLGGTLGNRRAVVVVHGTERNAGQYLDYVRDAAERAGDGGATLLIAPQFLTLEEIEAYALPETAAYWTDGGWKRGDRSQDGPAHPRPDRISSFAVLEQFIRELQILAPDLESVVIAGHSAGGQFAQRFAAGNGFEGDPDRIDVRYVSANPSSYLYFSPERIVPGSVDTFAVPSGSECQNGYNDYKYGTEDLNDYMSAVGAGELAARYRTRTVAYLLGEYDNDPADPFLDTTCPAAHQGSHRLERGELFFRHLVDQFGEGIRSRHELSVIPGVGHSGRAMLQSDCALYHLFRKPEFASACGGNGGGEPPPAPQNLQRADLAPAS